MYKETDKITDYVAIETEHGNIVIELDPKVAPISVANFQRLVSKRFYDGLIFHRVIKNFMIQGGDPKGDGTGGSEECIKGEFAVNGVNNPLSHKRGVVSMARRAYPYNSASSQFFICHANAEYLDGQYAAFGKVVEGMDVVDKIACTKVGAFDKPVVNQTMKRVYFVE